MQRVFLINTKGLQISSKGLYISHNLRPVGTPTSLCARGNIIWATGGKVETEVKINKCKQRKKNKRKLAKSISKAASLLKYLVDLPTNNFIRNFYKSNLKHQKLVESINV